MPRSRRCGTSLPFLGNDALDHRELAIGELINPAKRVAQRQTEACVTSRMHVVTMIDTTTSVKDRPPVHGMPGSPAGVVAAQTDL
jgi:hypothetical protein